MIGVAVVFAALAAAVIYRPDATGAGRLSRLAPPIPRARAGLPAAAAFVVAGVATVVVVGVPVGIPLGLVVALAGPRLLEELKPASVRREREQLVRELPLLLDLLAACLAGGAGPVSAAEAVAGALPGPCGRRLRAVVDALAAGTPPGEAWLALAGGVVDDPLAPAARVLARAGESGTPAAVTVGRLAADAHAAAVAAGAQAARRVGVLVVGPLGLCFLPAFVLVGIVPVVVGLAAPLFRAL